MTHRARPWRSPSSALLPVATAAVAAIIFIADAITAEKLTVSVSYVVVVLLAARFTSARGIVLVGAGCVGLTALAFLLPGVTEPPAPGVKASISAALIGLTTFLVPERKRAMEALRASEERWRAMVETAPIGIITFGSEHRRYVTANKSFQLMTGYTEEELRNLTPQDITHEDDRERLRKHVDQIVAGPQRSYRIEKRYRRKDGEIVWADINTFVVRATDKHPSFPGVVAVDITDRKRAEEALQQAHADLARVNRVMLLGEMTASIAHEINQPIAAVITNANAGLRWLGMQQPDLDEVRQALGRIVRDGSRAGEVIDRIRALVRKVPPRREVLNLNEAIHEVVSLTQTEMQRHGVTLESRLANDLPLVSADRVQLQQVLINLIINAIEAMAGAGDG